MTTHQQSAVEDAVIEMIRSRGIVGRAKYGHTMDRKDVQPAEWAQHLQEELADALQYAERLKMGVSLLADARRIMVSLRDESGWESAGEWIKAHDSQFPPDKVKKMQILENKS